MRKVLILFLILLLCVLGYLGFTNGISLGVTEIKSYTSIQDNYDALTKQIYNITEKTKTEFPNKEAELESSFEQYTKLKKEYEDKIKSYSSSSNSAKNIFVYDIDFLWARIGTHATTGNVDIDLDIAENSSGTTAVGNYCLCDFYFTARGSYFDISNFIKALEDDNELSFPIEGFKLLPYDKGNLVATFKVTEMPLNKEDLEINGTSMSTGTTMSDNTSTSKSSGDIYSNNAVGNSANKEGIQSALNVVITEVVTSEIKESEMDMWIKGSDKGSKIFDDEIKKQFKSTDKGSITSSDYKNKKYSGTATLDGINYTWSSDNGTVSLTQK